MERRGRTKCEYPVGHLFNLQQIFIEALGSSHEQAPFLYGKYFMTHEWHVWSVCSKMESHKEMAIIIVVVISTTTKAKVRGRGQKKKS